VALRIIVSGVVSTGAVPMAAGLKWGISASGGGAIGVCVKGERAWATAPGV